MCVCVCVCVLVRLGCVLVRSYQVERYCPQSLCRCADQDGTIENADALKEAVAKLSGSRPRPRGGLGGEDACWEAQAEGSPMTWRHQPPRTSRPRPRAPGARTPASASIFFLML